MPWIDIDQNTDEWLALRAGKVTGSPVSKIMANYGKSFGEPAKKYAVDIAVEQLTGVPIGGGFTNAHMERGHEEEPIARGLYQQTFFREVTNGGFFDNGDTGVSPDGLISTDGIIEIKSAMPSIHYERIRKNAIDSAYRWQCSFELKESGREWLDFVSFCSMFPKDNRLFVVRLYAADLTEDFKKIDLRLIEFFGLVEDIKNRIEGARWIADV